MTRPSASTTVSAEHVVAHRAVANRGGPRRARRGHAADRGIGAGIDRKHQAGVLQVRIELEPRQSGLDRNVEIFGAEAKHPRHARQVDRDAAVNGVDVAFERAAHAERHDRRADARAQSLTMAATSSVESGKTTTSGSPGACHDSPWLWCSRTESDVETRSPRMPRSASITIQNHNGSRFQAEFRKLHELGPSGVLKDVHAEDPVISAFAQAQQQARVVSRTRDDQYELHCRQPMIEHRRAARRGLPLVRAGDARRSEGVPAPAVSRHAVQRRQDAAEDAHRRRRFRIARSAA